METFQGQNLMKIPKVLIIYNKNEGYSRVFSEFSIPCNNLNMHFNGCYKIIAVLTVSNNASVVFHHPKTDKWYEINDASSIIINKPIEDYLNSIYITMNVFLYIVDIFIDEIVGI